VKADSFQRFVLDQLELGGLRGVVCRAMFGGHGLYRRDAFFGILHKGRLYFKTDESTRAGYLKRGMTPFRPNARQTIRTYYEVPIDIVEDSEQLIAWAEGAIKAGRRAARRRPAARGGRRRPGPERAPGLM
jgi:DNA transformation protein